jgi:hypothetical protein
VLANEPLQAPDALVELTEAVRVLLERLEVVAQPRGERLEACRQLEELASDLDQAVGHVGEGDLNEAHGRRTVSLVIDCRARPRERFLRFQGLREGCDLGQQHLDLLGPGRCNDVDLVQLVGEEVDPPGSLIRGTTEPDLRLEEVPVLRAEARHVRGIDPTGAVEERAGRTGLAEHLVLVLPVQLAQHLRTLREHLGRHGPAVDHRPKAPAGGQRAAELHLAAGIVEEDGLHAARMRRVPDGEVPIASSKHKVERLDQQRLAGASLTAQDVESLREIDHHVFDRADVAHVQRLEHRSVVALAEACAQPAADAMPLAHDDVERVRIADDAHRDPGIEVGDERAIDHQHRRTIRKHGQLHGLVWSEDDAAIDGEVRRHRRDQQHVEAR